MYSKETKRFDKTRKWQGTRNYSITIQTIITFLKSRKENEKRKKYKSHTIFERELVTGFEQKISRVRRKRLKETTKKALH